MRYTVTVTKSTITGAGRERLAPVSEKQVDGLAAAERTARQIMARYFGKPGVTGPVQETEQTRTMSYRNDLGHVTIRVTITPEEEPTSGIREFHGGTVADGEAVHTVTFGFDEDAEIPVVGEMDVIAPASAARPQIRDFVQAILDDPNGGWEPGQVVYEIGYASLVTIR